MTISIKATDELKNTAYLRQRKSGTWYCVLPSGAPCRFLFAGIPRNKEVETEIALEACSTADEALGVVRCMGYPNYRYEAVGGATAQKPRSRIAITVNGGVAELADAENWPDGLELYIVDYDNGDPDDSEASFLNGHCSIVKHDAAEPDMTGNFARDAADAWRME